MSNTQPSTTGGLPKRTKVLLAVVAGVILAGCIVALSGCDTAPVASAQEIAASAASMAEQAGLDPAALTPEQAEHYVTLAAQEWAKAQGVESGWKYWAGTAIQILLGGNVGLALLTGRGRENIAAVASRDSSTRERIGSALAILIGTHTPRTPAAPASPPPAP